MQLVVRAAVGTLGLSRLAYVKENPWMACPKRGVWHRAAQGQIFCSNENGLVFVDIFRHDISLGRSSGRVFAIWRRSSHKRRQTQAYQLTRNAASYRVPADCRQPVQRNVFARLR
jgi:hypothetical protein